MRNLFSVLWLTACVAFVLADRTPAVAGSGVGACPAASIGTVCMDVPEATSTKGGIAFSNGGVTLVQTTFYLSINGGAPVADVAPASTPLGGGVANYTVNTVTCQKNTYSVTASQTDTGAPGAGEGAQSTSVSVTKDRTQDTGCQSPPVPAGLAIH